MNNQFGDRIKALREKHSLYLRQVAAHLQMDTAQLSKIEKGVRSLKKEQIPFIAEILKADVEDLQTLWLADQLYNMVEGEPMADEALKSVTKKLKKLK